MATDSADPSVLARQARQLADSVVAIGPLAALPAAERVELGRALQMMQNALERQGFFSPQQQQQQQQGWQQTQQQQVAQSDYQSPYPQQQQYQQQQPQMRQQDYHSPYGQQGQQQGQQQQMQRQPDYRAGDGGQGQFCSQCGQKLAPDGR